MFVQEVNCRLSSPVCVQKLSTSLFKVISWIKSHIFVESTFFNEYVLVLASASSPC